MYGSTCVGQPVGWCIADKEDQDVAKVLIEEIKLQSLNREVFVIMTFDGYFNCFSF